MAQSNVNSVARPRAFTLIELLVVIAIIGILASLLMPALSQAQYKSRLIGCISQMRQMSIGIMSYSVDNNNWYPATPEGRGHPIEISKPSSTAAYDWRPSFRDYFGTQLTNIMMCPLGEKAWEGKGQEDFDNYTSGTYGAKTPYAFYFGVPRNNSTDSYWAETASMRRVGDTFEPFAYPGRKFNILMSDCIINYGAVGNLGTMATHQSPVNSGTEGGHFATVTWGYVFLPDTSTTANVCTDDGSIKTYDNVGYAAKVSQDIIRFRPGSKVSYLIPADLER